MIEAFLDESGTHQNAPVVCVGAYAAEHHEWAAFEADWRLHLATVGVEYFHAKESGCDRLREPLAALIQSRHIFGWLSTVDREGYRTRASHLFKSRVGNAYAIAVYRCATAICLWAQREQLGPVAFVIEHGQPNVEFVKQTLEMLIGSDTFPVASVAVATKKEFVPLQAADFLAHCGGMGELAWLHRLLLRSDPGRSRHSHASAKDVEQWSAEMIQMHRQYRYRKKMAKQPR